MNAQAFLFQIVRLALIKVAPGVFNIALIPYLLVALGTASYGLYSTWLAYVMLVANTVAAIVSQPMYRYLSTRPEEREYFAGFAVGSSALAGLVSFGVAMAVGAPWLEALGFAVLSTGTVLGTALSVDFVVAGRIMRFAAYEAMRILVILLAIALPVLAGRQLTVGNVVLAMASSNLLPLVVLAGRRSFSMPDAGWVRQVVPYGLKSAMWLVLAGLPVVSAKSILMQAMPENAFGTYAAIADLTYRGFAIANAALIMWAFPLLSRQFDEGRMAEVRRTLRFTLLLYSAGGVAMLAGIVLVAERLSFFEVSALPGGKLAAIAITLASFCWHGMSISHKPYELTLRTTQMAGLMTVGVAAFYTLTFSLTRLAGLDALYVVTMSMTGVAIIYSLAALNQKVDH
jgi:O-antigen/teichoic acid export membrane protein